MKCEQAIGKSGSVKFAIAQVTNRQVAGAWSSAYLMETNRILSKCMIDVNQLIGKPNKTVQEDIRKFVDEYESQTNFSDIKEKRQHSLRSYPEYPDGLGIQEYLKDEGGNKTLAQFRLGDAGLGNRNDPSIKICPTCNNGPNTESHLVFRCKSVVHLKDMMDNSIDMASFMEKTDFCQNDDDKLKLFVGGDFSKTEILTKRGTYLSILRDKHLELMSELVQPIQYQTMEELKQWKCELCDFSTNSKVGLNIHIGRKHGTELH